MDAGGHRIRGLMLRCSSLVIEKLCDGGAGLDYCPGSAQKKDQADQIVSLRRAALHKGDPSAHHHRAEKHIDLHGNHASEAAEYLCNKHILPRLEFLPVVQRHGGDKEGGGDEQQQDLKDPTDKIHQTDRHYDQHEQAGPISNQIVKACKIKAALHLVQIGIALFPCVKRPPVAVINSNARGRRHRGVTVFSGSADIEFRTFGGVQGGYHKNHPRKRGLSSSQSHVDSLQNPS